MLLSLFLLVTYLFLFKEQKKTIKIFRYFIILALILLSFTLIFFLKIINIDIFFEPLNDLSNNYKVTNDLLEGYPIQPKNNIFFRSSS